MMLFIFWSISIFDKAVFLSVSDLHFKFFFPDSILIRTRVGNITLIDHLQMMTWPPLL